MHALPITTHVVLYIVISALYVGAAFASLREGRHRHGLREFCLALAYTGIAIAAAAEIAHHNLPVA